MEPSKNPKSINVSRKYTLMVDDSILKHVQGWRLNKRTKSNVLVRSFPGVLTNGIWHHVKDVLRIYHPTSWGKRSQEW